MAIIHRTIENTSGIPLGGIGTGSIEIREDGLFHDWQIFNTGKWAATPRSDTCCGGEREPNMTPEDLAFIIRTEGRRDGVKVRRLALREQLNCLYSLPWAKCVRSIRFRGEFPAARLEYNDETLPVEVRAEIFAPFVPHDPRESAGPGFFVRFLFKNVSREDITVSILGHAANPIPSGTPVHTVAQDRDATLITLAAKGNGVTAPCFGNITFSVKGGEHSYITGTYSDERTRLRTSRKPYGVMDRSYLFEFREKGALTNLAPKKPPDDLPADFKAESLSASQKRKLLRSLLTQSAFLQKYRRIMKCEPARLKSEAGLAEFLNDAQTEMKDTLGPIRANWRDAILCSRTRVAPDAEGSLVFALAWFFPNHTSPTGKKIGHMYSNWFKSSLDVSRRLNRNFDTLREKTIGFADALFDTTLDYEVADSISAQLSTLPKSSWWTEDGEFGVWEGLGCCGLQTTDITYDASFSITALFPSLQMKQMRLTQRFQLPDGRVPHLFESDLSQPDKSYDRVDMNPQYVLLVAKDYCWTGDRRYLKAMWPSVVKAIENTKLLDGDDDGLPDHGCGYQTYDQWEFRGCPSYIASLWLASLKAGMRLAREMNDRARLRCWQAWYGRGVKNFEKLWNGEYYVLWKEMRRGGSSDECCMTDQIDGDWFTALMGWGSVLPPERIRAALRAILKHNYDGETGLRNASYPADKKPRLSTYKNAQADGVWTGIEYALASMMIDYGMAAEGIAVARTIHDRYLRAGRVWNHVECGNHYYRAMSSWALLLSLLGFRIDAPAQKLTFAPARNTSRFRAPFVTCTAWGHYTQENRSDGCAVTVECRSGSQRLKQLCLGAKMDLRNVVARVNSARVPCSAKVVNDLTQITFARVVKITEGDQLTIADCRV